MISLNVISDLFENELAFEKRSLKTCFYHTVLLLPDKLDEETAKTFLGPQLNDTIFCGTKDSCKLLAEMGPHLAIVCIFKPGEACDFGSRYEDSIVYIESSSSPFSIVSRIQERNTEISAWVDSMRLNIIEGASYQSLVDIGEIMLGNFILLLNADFRVLAYSSHYEHQSDHLAELIRRGFHSQETVDEFESSGRISAWRKQRGVLVEEWNEGTVGKMMSYVFRKHGEYAGHCLMHCTHNLDSAGLADVFLLFSEHVELCLKQNIQSHSSNKEIQLLFEELIKQRPFTQKTFAQRLNRVSLKQYETYCLMVFSFNQDSSDLRLTDHYLRMISQSFPDAYVASYDENIVMLINMKLDNELIYRLQSFANGYHCVVGVSNTFYNLRDFTFAYQQAHFALLCATEPYETAETSYLRENKHSIFLFKDFSPRYVAEAARNTSVLMDYCMQHSILGLIYEEDKKHGTDDLRLLYTYLRNDRRVAQTCKELYLQRGTFLYRLKRLQESYDLDLDDFKIRQQLLLEYLLFSPDYDSVYVMHDREMWNRD